MVRMLFYFFGYLFTYTCEWGEYKYRYDGVDRMAMRPIHKTMSVAPPWAKLRISRCTGERPVVTWLRRTSLIMIFYKFW